MVWVINTMDSVIFPYYEESWHGNGMGLILLVLPLLILSVILSLLLFLYISYEEKSFKNTWGQLLIMSLWLGYEALLYTQALG